MSTIIREVQPGLWEVTTTEERVVQVIAYVCEPEGPVCVSSVVVEKGECACIEFEEGEKVMFEVD